jgi:hypothetical protein
MHPLSLSLLKPLARAYCNCLSELVAKLVAFAKKNCSSSSRLTNPTRLKRPELPQHVSTGCPYNGKLNIKEIANRVTFWKSTYVSVMAVGTGWWRARPGWWSGAERYRDTLRQKSPIMRHLSTSTNSGMSYQSVIKIVTDPSSYSPWPKGSQIL